MIDKLEITIDVIVHATEDISKIFQSFNDVLEIEENDFNVTETTGRRAFDIFIYNRTYFLNCPQGIFSWSFFDH